MKAIWIFAVINLLIHILVNVFAGYGIFRDELYYLACATRLDWGYVDQPPLSIFMLKGIVAFLGDSVFAIRLLPAIFGSIAIYFTGLIAKKFGADTFGIAIACIMALIAPVRLAFGTIYSMNSIDLMLWTIAFYMFVLIIDGGTAKLWLWLGLLTGLGMMNKISMGWFCLGIFIALIATPQRKHLKTIYPYLCGLIAFLIFLPYIIWNFQHDFAHFEFIRNASKEKYGGLNPLDMLLSLILNEHPLSFPLWLGGLYLLIFKLEKKYLPVALVFLTTFAILVINWHSKAEYLAAALTPLFAAGGLFAEKLFNNPKLRLLKIVVPALLLFGGIVTAPLTLPVLPPETYISYVKTTGINPASSEGLETETMHQFYADMFGWEDMAKTISMVYSKLDERDKKSCVFYGADYGRAAAIEYFSKKYTLPPVLSGHNNYYLWGCGECDYKVIINMGHSRENLLEYFDQVDSAAFFSTKYNMPYENNLPVFVCRNLKYELKDFWKRLKSYQ